MHLKHRIFVIVALLAVTVSTVQAEGCKLLTMNGEELWHQPQSVIKAALAAACESGETQTIDAGIGTYGPNTLLVSCFGGDIATAFLNMTGYDEWGKWNIIRFGPDYLPVNPPANGAAPDVEDNRCAYEVGETEFSVDGSHMGGYDIWDPGSDGFLNEGDDFITWSKTDLGLPACQFKRS